MALPTLKKRDAIAAQRRADAIARAEPLLAEVAREHGGRFWLFGSAARGELRRDSDMDILADFPVHAAWPAIIAAEGVCAEVGVPCDIVARSMCDDRFLSVVAPDLKPIA